MNRLEISSTRPKNLGIAYLLTALSIISLPGIQRFYLGKYGTGVLYLLTGGVFFLGTLYDLITMRQQVYEINMALGYAPDGWDLSESGRKSKIIEAKYSIYEEKQPEPKKPLELKIVQLAEEAELNQLTLKDLIKAGIDIDEGKSALLRLVDEGVCQEVDVSGVKHYIF